MEKKMKKKLQLNKDVVKNLNVESDVKGGITVGSACMPSACCGGGTYFCPVNLTQGCTASCFC